MNKAFEVKGSVRKLEQRRQGRQDPNDPLANSRDLQTYDVEFSPSGEVLLETWYTHSGLAHQRTRSEYGEAGRLVRTTICDGTARPSTTILAVCLRSWGIAATYDSQ